MSAQTDRLKAKLAALSPAARAAVVPALVQSGQELVDAIKANVPVRHGALRESVTETLPGGQTPPSGPAGSSRKAGPEQVIVTAGDANVTYAEHVEYGTKHAHAEPYFWPAYRKKRRAIRSNVRQALAASIRESWGT